MTYILSDTYIGDFPVTQLFGVNPGNYAQFGLKGHNGLDIGVPGNTQIIAASDGWVKEVGSDPTGYGNYVKIIHNGFLTLYAHLDHAVVSVNDKVVLGQLIGFSDNTGNSSGPHLHFGVAPCNDAGEKTESDNGYAGYIDPNGNRCSWNITNPAHPTTPTSLPETPMVTIAQSELDSIREARDTHYNDLQKQLEINKELDAENQKLRDALSHQSSTPQTTPPATPPIESPSTPPAEVPSGENNPNPAPGQDNISFQLLTFLAEKLGSILFWIKTHLIKRG